MNQADWQTIEELFNAALEIPTEERAAFLDSACSDKIIREEVESLLKNIEKEDSFLDKPQLSLGLSVLGTENNKITVGEKIGRYRIIRLLGEGGMGAVYLAEDLPLNRQVALKLLPEYLVEEDESVSRFQKEALAASAISHPNIAHIYEAGTEGNRRFIAMEFVEGITLRELLKQKKPDLVTALDIVLQTANALASAHSAGIVHRDIKPENIMIRRDGYIKVLDFGIAKLLQNSEDKDSKNFPSARTESSMSLTQTTPGLVMGTMGYISPEQLKSKNVDSRTDIWSLGIVLYEILSGSKPFGGKTAEDVGKAILQDTPKLISFTNLDSKDEISLQNILAQTLNKQAEKRYQTAKELADDLKEVKQNLEFTQQFSTGEVNTEKSFLNISGTFEQTRNTSFITKTKQFWINQSLSRKALLLAGGIGVLTFVVGILVQYFGWIYINKPTKFETFSSESRNRWQISTLISQKKKVNEELLNFRFSPDGNYYSYLITSTNVNDIYVNKTGNGQPVKITDGKGINQTPIWSPDGQKIAFVSNRENKIGIWSISFLGGTPEFLAPLTDNMFNCQLRKWSNDGKKIFFEARGKLKTISLENGEIEEIKLPEDKGINDFSISNDEKLIAFSARDDNSRQIWFQTIGLNDAKVLTDGRGIKSSPEFAPDNQRVFYSSDQGGNFQIYQVDLRSLETTQLTFGDINANHSLISSDGTKIIYHSENNEANIFSTNLQNYKEKPETSNTKMQLFSNISDDEKNLVYQITDEKSKIFNSPIIIKDLRNEQQIFKTAAIGGFPKWSSDGNSIIYLKNVENKFNIWKVDSPNFDNEQQLTKNGISMDGYTYLPFNLMATVFSISKNQRKIVYSSYQDGLFNLWSVNENGSDEQALTKNQNGKMKYYSPLWSTDEKQIAFISRLQTEANKFNYGVSILADGQIKNVFERDSLIRLIGWQGNDLLIAVNKDNEVEVVKIFTKDNFSSKKIINLKGAYLHNLVLSPDTKKIAFPAHRDGIANIYIYSTNGKEIKITSNLDETSFYSSIVWSPKGTDLFYSKQTGGIQISMITDKNLIEQSH